MPKSCNLISKQPLCFWPFRHTKICNSVYYLGIELQTTPAQSKTQWVFKTNTVPCASDEWDFNNGYCVTVNQGPSCTCSCCVFQRVFLDECVCHLITFENQIFEKQHLPESWKSNQSQVKTHWHLRANSSSPEWTQSHSDNENGLIFFFSALWTEMATKQQMLSLFLPRLPLWLQSADDQRYLGGEKDFFIWLLW